MIAGDTPNAITSERESSSAPKRLSPRSSRAMRPSSPSRMPATRIAISAFSQSPAIAQRTPVSPVAASMHETISGLHRLGFVDTRTMRHFDRSCMAAVTLMSPQDIAGLRAREGVSQSVFAIHLNVTKSTVAQWESGEKKPAGPALKLLNLVQKKGLGILA